MDNQVNYLNNISRFFKNFNTSKYKPHYSSIFYIATYANTIGKITFEKINQIKGHSFFLKFLIIIKEIFYSFKYFSYKTQKSNIASRYNKIILTWGIDGSFNKKGVFKDRYFNISSNQTLNTLWFVIYLGKTVPRKLEKNVVLLKASNNIGINLISFFYFLLKDIKYIFTDFFYYVNLKSSHFFFSNILNKELEIYLKNNVQKLIMPYEGQPFQNNIARLIRYKKIKTKIFGYIHSPPLPMPSNFMFKAFSPDKIFLNGKDQFYCFHKYLGWSKKKIKIIPSFRFSKSKEKKQKNKIFLPLSINNVEESLASIDYLNDNNIIDINKYSIQNHPLAQDNKNNLRLISEIEKHKKNQFKRRSKDNKNFLIFIGNSGGIIEFLERGNQVIHICENPIYDIYSEKIWRSIVRHQLKPNIFIYKLKQKGKLIKLGNRKQNLKIFKQIF